MYNKRKEEGVVMYKFECVTTDKDYYDFNMYHAWYSPDAKKQVWFSRLYVPALLLIMFIVYIIQCDDLYTLAVEFLFFAIISIAWIFMIKPISIFFLKRNIKSMNKKGNKAYSEYSLIEFTEDCFTETTDKAKTQYQYNAVYKIRVNEPKAIYIYINSVIACIVPLSLFETEDEKKNFIEFLCQKTKLNVDK